ncbi:hypothetical protein OS120_27795, partial [Klebsiella pneumoniae]|nr:hypothetical protein [Klebsiella pneumoniae]
LMMNPVPWLQMTNMISYQGLVRTFLNPVIVHEDTRYTWLIINEEGKLLSLPINNNATLMAVTAIRHDDYIVGDALMLEEHEFQ